METIEENNKLIAEFMGYELVDKEWDLYETPECMYDIRDTSGDLNMKPSGSEMCFHSSWDWLMPVVEKIEKTNDGTIEIFSKNMVRISFNKTSIVCFTNNLIGNTYEAALLFIQWYNEQNN